MSRFAVAVFFAIACTSSSSAHAGRCDGDFEFVRGSWVSTRYCRAVQIAEVARDLGMHVSPQTILTNPGRADEVCRFVGTDIRAQPACDQVHSIFQLSF